MSAVLKSVVLKPHLVVVDDEPQVLAAIEDHLEDEFVVHAVTNGAAALVMLGELKNIEVLLSDQRMPEMAGDELFSRAASLSDAAHVMITGYADLEAVVRAVNKGRIFGYITKPWDRPALQMMIHKAAEHSRLMRELQHERELLDNLMQNAPDEIYFKSLDHRYIRMNDAAARGHGIASPREAIGRVDAAFSNDPERVTAMHAEDRKVAEAGTALTFVERRVRDDGSIYWVSKTKAPVRDVRGAVSSIVAIGRDITDLKYAEQESRLLFEITEAMAAASDIEAALESALQKLCGAADWDYGEGWIMREGALRVAANLTPSSPAIGAFAKAARAQVFGAGEGLPGAVWRSVQTVWIEDLQSAPALHGMRRAEPSLAAGLSAVLAVPVTGDDGLPRAVLLLFRRAAPAGLAREAALATAVARQLGSAIERKQNAAQLAQRETLLRSVLEALPVGVRVADRGGRMVMQNPAAESIWGERGTAGRTVGRWVDTGNPLVEAEWPLQHALESGEPESDRIIEIERPDASRRVIAASGVPIREQTQGVTGALMVFEDITERRAQELRIQRLTRMHATLSAINTTIVRAQSREDLFREAGLAVVEIGKFRFFHVWLPDAERSKLVLAAQAGLAAYATAEVPLDTPIEAGRPTVVDAFLENRMRLVNDLRSEELRSPMRRQMIEAGCRALVSLPLQNDGTCAGVLSFAAGDADFFDEEELKLLAELAGDIAFALETLEKRDQLYFLSSHDPLTGLANRASLIQRIAQMIPAPGAKGEGFALVAINLRRFRNVNDSLGRHVGDELLRQTAARLAGCVGRERVAHLGADVFCALIHGVTGVNSATRATVRIREALADPYALAERQLHVDTRAAVALYPADGEEAETLCGNVEAALKSKRGGDDAIVFYKSELNARVGQQLDIESRLRTALHDRQFVLFCQPKVDAITGTVVSAEALIRWQDPKEGLIPPFRFIPVLEETGLIVEVGAWALEEAARIGARLRERGLAVPRIAVNISQVQMRRVDFVREVVEAVERGSGGAGHCVDLEITESLLAENMGEAVRKLKLLRDAGFSIAVDDFGTGYSSLGYLAKLPVDVLKIDRSFIIAMTEEADAMVLVSTIINLAHAFRLKVVAEGVETQEQLKMLRLLRCEQIQGYLFHKPLPESQFAAVLAEQGKATQ